MKLCTQTEKKTFQRLIALNLEHKNLLISILVQEFSDIKKYVKDNGVGWVGQCLNIIQFTAHFFEELKTILPIEDNLPQKLSLHKNRKRPRIILPIPKVPLFISKVYIYCKNSGLRKRKSFLEEFAFFLCTFEMKMVYLVFFINQGNSFWKETKIKGKGSL